MRDQSHGGGVGRQMSILRRLKALVVVLIISNMALGVFGFYCLRAIDRKYSDLINRTVPTLNDMQTLTAVCMEAMRSVNPTLFGGSAEARTEMARRARIAVGRDRELRESILKRQWLSSDNQQRVDFQKSGETFSRGAAELIPLLESGQIAEATREREQSIRPVWDRYVAATTKAADVLEAQSIKTSSVFTERTVSISKMMLGLASWPVIALSAFFLITAVLAVVVLLLFDRKVA